MSSSSWINVFYGIPKNYNFDKYLDDNYHIEISERKLSLIDIIRIDEITIKGNNDSSSIFFLIK